MTPDLSRAAALTLQGLTGDARDRLVSAVVDANDVGDVPEPYRSWLRDVDAVPDEDRAGSRS